MIIALKILITILIVLFTFTYRRLEMFLLNGADFIICRAAALSSRYVSTLVLRPSLRGLPSVSPKQYVIWICKLTRRMPKKPLRKCSFIKFFLIDDWLLPKLTGFVEFLFFSIVSLVGSRSEEQLLASKFHFLGWVHTLVSETLIPRMV